jgi:alpha-1,2-mannosyltransferase
VSSRLSARQLLIAGAAAFIVAIGLWLHYALTHSAIYTQDPVDLGVYLDGGEIARHLAPTINCPCHYNPHAYPGPLYGWGGATSLNLAFTYTPFAAVFFALPSLAPWKIAPDLSQAVNIILLGAALWFTFRGLGIKDRRVRMAAMLLAAAVTLWLQPVLRTLYLGQINLFLMALIMWDLTQPATYLGGRQRWWRGWGVGVAAGIKLVPLVFVPYLLLARRYREGIGTLVGFVLTVLIGFAVFPKDSFWWWIKLNVVSGSGSRTGFIGWTGDQSLHGLITRLSGSIAAGNHLWLAAEAITIILGVIAATILDRGGYPIPAILVASLTGLLVSPISWDHHWVWAAPAIATLGYYGYQYWEPAKAKALGCWAGAAALLVAFWAWPDHWFQKTMHLSKDSFGLVWLAPDTNPKTYETYGDKPYYVEYHFHGLTLLTGNIYVLTGMAAFVIVLLISLRIWTGQRRRTTEVSSEDAECVPAPHSAPTT